MAGCGLGERPLEREGLELPGDVLREEIISLRCATSFRSWSTSDEIWGALIAEIVGAATSTIWCAVWARASRDIALPVEAKTILTLPHKGCRKSSLRKELSGSGTAESKELLHPLQKLSWLTVAKFLSVKKHLKTALFRSCCAAD